MASPVIEALNKRLATSVRTRILAFGSSNTGRFLYGMHWFDVVHTGIGTKYGAGRTHFINTGIGGNTTRDLLERFDPDAAFYEPHLVFLTIGGNDMKPERNLPPDLYKENLLKLHRKFSNMGTMVIFQTYYSPDPDLATSPLDTFYAYMDIVREVAASTNSGLIDHLKRWETLRVNYNDRYKKMMIDGFHVNQTGNVLLGLDILQELGIEPSPGREKNPFPAFDEALENQKLMNEMANRQ